MKTGFYSGSFDPFTNGHLHVIKTAAGLLDNVVIGIGTHPQKARRFDKDIMKQEIEKVLERENIKNASVIIYENLTVDSAKENNANILIRGIRNGMDYDYEENLAFVNEEISGMDTFYIRAGKLGYLSSSMVMELLNNGKDVSSYLPEEIYNVVKNK